VGEGEVLQPPFIFIKGWKRGVPKTEEKRIGTQGPEVKGKPVAEPLGRGNQCGQK